MKRKAIRGGMAVIGGMFAIRLFRHFGKDLARYNRLRAMSDEAPLWFGKGATRARKPTNAAAYESGPLSLLMTLPADVLRYLRLETM